MSRANPSSDHARRLVGPRYAFKNPPYQDRTDARDRLMLSGARSHLSGLIWDICKWLALPLLIYWFVAHLHLDVPGIYEDAVDPDYLIVKLLNPSSPAPFPDLPGNFVLQKFPVLAQVYHGALPYYLGLPGYAVFGTAVRGIRLTNILFGSMVLTGVGLFLRAFKISPLLVAMTLTAIALDPGFLFSFRTQFYICLLPLALLMSSIAFTECARQKQSLAFLLLSGVLAGLAGYGYFIYFFLIPAAFVYVVLTLRHSPRATAKIAIWISGVAIGLSPYLIGELLIIHALGGLRPWLQFLTENLSGLAPVAGHFQLLDRLGWFAWLTSQTLMSSGPLLMMLGEFNVPFIPPTLKLVLLVAPTCVAIAVMIVSRILGRPLALGLVTCICLMLGFLALVLVFGHRLWLHHEIAALPVLYAALAVSCAAMPEPARRAWSALALVSLLVLAVSNVVETQRVYARLSATGGVGMASDAIVHFDEDIGQDPRSRLVLFPDWGVFPSFVMVTAGKIPFDFTVSREAARGALCLGKDLTIAVLGKDQLSRIDAYSKTIDFGTPQIKAYNQRNGPLILTAATWTGGTSASPGCAR